MNAPETHLALSASAVQTPHSESRSATKNSVRQLVANLSGSVVILGIGVVGYLYFGQKPEVPTDTSQQNAADVAALVDVAAVKVWNEPFKLYIDGEATTYRVLTVGAEVTGRILSKPDSTRSGTFVLNGEKLFEIDPVNYELDEQRLAARVQQAQEELQAVVVDLENTDALVILAKEENQLQKKHLERVRKLYEDRQATSESEWDTARQQELTSRNALLTLENQRNALNQTQKVKSASLELARAELAHTRIDLKRCIVKSPIDGRIVDDVVEVGDYVKPGDPMVHVSDSSRMEIKCSLKSEELAWVWQEGQRTIQEPLATSESAASDQDTDNQDTDTAETPDPFRIPNIPCEVSFEFQGVETIWDGYLSRYEGSGMDRETRMFPCRVLVEKPAAPIRTSGNAMGGDSSDPRLKVPTLLSGMYVTVRIPITPRAPLLEVPAEAVRPGEQIWILRDETLRIVPVTLVRVDGESALVQSNGALLKAGDSVITSPLASAIDGMQVALKTESTGGASADGQSPAEKSQEVAP